SMTTTLPGGARPSGHRSTHPERAGMIPYSTGSRHGPGREPPLRADAEEAEHAGRAPRAGVRRERWRGTPSYG
ncbi:hypothetical protein, partial [Arthrobacter agilis]|uniref:hypothetical protein n=1 Tax=Arthrobacter agilis TaxID=37921 RepID=UPI001ABF700B